MHVLSAFFVHAVFHASTEYLIFFCLVLDEVYTQAKES